jgi:FkbM family methyltransferase
MLMFNINNGFEDIRNKNINLVQDINELNRLISSKNSNPNPNPITPHPVVDRIKLSNTNPQYSLYLHGPGDMISDRVWHAGIWDDCQNILNTAVSKLKHLKKLIIVEVGTNIGACAIPYIAQGHKVYGFEPFPPSVDLIRKSIKANSNLPGELILIESGASNKKGVANVFFEHNNLGNSRVGNNTENYNIKQFHYQKHQQVRLTTIDSVVSEHVNLLKMDCQGYEYFAAMGAIGLIKNYGIDVVIFEYTPIFIEANNQNPVDLLRFFSDRRFTLYHDNKILNPNDFVEFTRKLKNTKLDTMITCVNKNTIF